MFKIEDGRSVFYQWDLDRRLVVSDSKVTQVHFSNASKEQSLTVETYLYKGKRVADVPNILLQETRPIRVYAYDGYHTMHSAVYSVTPRPKPNNYMYTPTEVYSWEGLSRRIDDLGEEIRELEMKPGPQGPSGPTGPQGIPGEPGKDGYTPIKGVDYFDGETGPQGEPGKDGYTPIKGVDYFDGETGPQGIPGEPGKDGAPGQNGKDGVDGYTPIKGTDYWTDEDKADIVAQVTNNFTNAGYQTADDVLAAIQRELGVIENGTY